MKNGGGFRHGPIRGRPIRTKNSLGRQELQEQATERFLVGTGKHRVEMFALPILHHKDRDLLIGQPAFLGMSSERTRWAQQVTLPRERQKKVRLVRFNKSRKFSAVFLGRVLEHAVAPAKRRCPMNTDCVAALRTLRPSINAWP